jgi:hypothetical protein
MKREIRDTARELRQSGMSVRAIANTLHVSSGSVSVWVRDIELTENQKEELKKHQRKWGGQNAGAQTNKRKHQQKRMECQEAGKARAREGRPLHLTGCMLYWAEGSKDRNQVFFVNSDGQMLRLFMRFLREELNVEDTKITLLIHCHSNDENEKQRISGYWIDFLGLPPTCYTKVITKQGSDSRRKRHENGICGIRVFSTELAQHIFGAIQEYGGFDNPDWLF